MQRTVRGIVLAACGLTAGALAPTAAAEVVVFDNTAGTFVWTATQASCGGVVTFGTHLDIMQPPTQSGAPTLISLEKVATTPCNEGDLLASTIGQSSTGSIVQIARDPDPLFVSHPEDDKSIFPLNTPLAYALGDAVGLGADWQPGADYAWSTAHLRGQVLGDSAFIGVRIPFGDDIHYGWIELHDGEVPVRWAYETQPNTPITIVPAPAAGALLLGAGAAAARRKR